MNTESLVVKERSTENENGPNLSEVEFADSRTEQSPSRNDVRKEDIEISATEKEEIDTDQPFRESPVTENKEDPTKRNATIVDQQQSNKPEMYTESNDIAELGDSEPPVEQKSTEGVDLPAEEEKKDDEELVRDADQLKERAKAMVDVESPSEQAPADSHKDSTKGNAITMDETETKRNTISSDNNESPSVGQAEESRTRRGTCRNLVFSVLFLILCGGALLYFLVFNNNADTTTTSSLLNDINSGGSSDSFSPSSSPSTTLTGSTNASMSSGRPTRIPTRAPSLFPTISGVPAISDATYAVSSSQPSKLSSVSESPSIGPTVELSKRPTIRPSESPSTGSTGPSIQQSNRPTPTPTNHPSAAPSDGTLASTGTPTDHPSAAPSDATLAPTRTSTDHPSILPSEVALEPPTRAPTIRPSVAPSTTTVQPTRTPTSLPSVAPSQVTLDPTAPPVPTTSPTDLATMRPTKSPTRVPTTTPSRLPVTLPVTPPPTASPSVAPVSPRPTSPPTRPPDPIPELGVKLRNYLENDFGVGIESTNGNQAVAQLLEEARADGELPLTPKLVQRYAMINMEFALFDISASGFVDPIVRQNQRNWGALNQDECSWSGIKCNGNREVTDVKLLGKDLQGSIPSEIGMLQALTQLDLASNKLQGSLPEELYNCVSLKKLFLYQNRLTGTISDKIINLWSLTDFNLSSNRISGRIPSTMRSNGRGIYRIRTFNVYDNQMTGSVIPTLDGANLRQLYYLDLGRNRFSGILPTFLDFVRLRHLHLDHNQFSGSLGNVINSGDGRLQVLTVNDNKLTGTLPGWHTFITEMVQYTAQNNQFTTMIHRTCKLNVMETGEMPEFKSDCDVCVCGKDDQMCKNCYN
ncbi:unnamed protein product [Cylindrotheca closterium]|uniref:Leucine-rich repeat-containing N-terminal plant-type domain-containing protein n=1 Tax=Cylindrotheca closterium TaxID=2856 RepID=A0AAD2G742_9STRA|nr:unnamed protein product [Cylindrotheca closterium]